MSDSLLSLITPYLYATLVSLVMSVVVIVSVRSVHKQAYKIRTVVLNAPLLGSFAIMAWVSSLCLIHCFSLNYPNLCPAECNQLAAESGRFICTSFITLVFASFGFAVSSGVTNYYLGDKIAIHLFHAKRFNPNEEREIHETLSRLSRKAGVRCPKLYLIERSTPIVFAAGRRNSSSIIVSVGLLETLSSEELKASLAHEISHIKNNDSLIRTAASSLKFATPFNFLSHLIEPAIYREREFLADEASVTLTNEPSALISALIKLSEACNIEVKGNFFCRSAIGFLLKNPTRGGIFSKHPPLEERLNRLLQLEKRRTFKP